MNRVDEIVERVRLLSPAELREFLSRLAAYDDELWDEKFEADVKAGKWDALAEKAIREDREGKSTPL